MENYMTEQTATVAAEPKTLQEQLVAAEARVAKIKAKIAAQTALEVTVAGDNVTFKYGRAEKVRTLSGTVQAVADVEGTRMASITSGTGLDVKVYKVRVADILTNSSADERNAAQPVEAQPEVADAADPLDAE